MAYSIERDHDSPELAKVTLWTPHNSTRFTLSLPFADLRQPRGRELLTAWALGIATIPGAGIEIHEVANLLDLVDTTNTTRTPLHRPRYRQW